MSTSMSMNFTAAQAPDGTVWVSITHMMGASSFTWGVPAETGLDFLRQFSENFRGAREEAMKVAKSGPTLIAANGQPFRLPGKDGHTCPLDGDDTTKAEDCVGCQVIIASKIDD